MKRRAVIFDLDGTLLDTIADLSDSVNNVLQRNHLPEHSDDDYKQWVGDGALHLILRALPEEKRGTDLVQKILKEFVKEYTLLWDKKTVPYTGIDNLLDTLTEMRIIKAVLSNKTHEFTVRMVETMLAKWKFEKVFGHRENTPRKPNPGSALEICSALNLNPCECLFIGDSDNDMKTAVAAGMVPVGVLWGYRHKAELLSNGAKYIVSHPSEIPALL